MSLMMSVANLCFTVYHGVEELMPISSPNHSVSDCVCVCVRMDCVFACTRMHAHSHIRALLSCAFHLCLPSSPGDGCCEIQEHPVVFYTPVFWGNSQPGAVDQEDLVMTGKWR